ncbi:MAG TPA: hypothetical protein VII33_10065, partial [Nakamurella sp.]
MVTGMLLALAVLAWPASGARARLGGRRGRRLGRWSSAGGRGRPRAQRSLLVAAACGAVGASFALAGLAGAMVAGVVGATAWVLTRQAVADRRRRAAVVDMLAGLRMLGRELHAGAEPAVAADSACSAARGDGAVVLAELAQLTRSDDRSKTG